MSLKQVAEALLREPLPAEKQQNPPSTHTTRDATSPPASFYPTPPLPIGDFKLLSADTNQV